MEHSAHQRRVSRVLHWVGDVTARSATTVVVVILLLSFGVVLAITHFSATWEAGFATVVGAITLVMLFVIQHTQSRHQTVLQLKLDELIRTSPHADDLLVHIEGADDAELIEVEKSHIAHHESVRGAEGLDVIEFIRDAEK
ncbi:MAG TPA: low affinity iron permease family protein [Acidimicrobiales bacterium]|nr:low affinity iron permease family protein [Acidimicrobiales bacterium]